MKVSTEIDNNFGYEKITQLVDNIPLRHDGEQLYQYGQLYLLIYFFASSPDAAAWILR
jgi:hypothetical protein